MKVDIKRYFANINTLLYNVFNYHWNVSGGLFLTLHKLYNEQYDFIFKQIDRLGEIQKAKGMYPCTCLPKIEEAADIKTMESKDYPAKKTIEMLIEQFSLMNDLAVEYGTIAEGEGDLVLVDFFTDESDFYSKQLYFLRQFIK